MLVRFTACINAVTLRLRDSNDLIIMATSGIPIEEEVVVTVYPNGPGIMGGGDVGGGETIETFKSCSSRRK